MKTALTIALCLCLLTFGPGGGRGGSGAVIVKPTDCLRASSDGSSSGNVLCKPSYSSDKTEDNFMDVDTLGDAGNRDDEVSISSKEQFSRSARAPSHQFMRFGRGHKFFRFGRDVKHSFMRFGRGNGDEGEPQLSHKFFRFGRGGATLDDDEFNDGKHLFMRFGKSDEFNGGHKFFRFGKKSISDEDENDMDVDVDAATDYVEEPSNGDEATDEDMSRTIRSEHKFFRFGRTPAVKGHAFVRYGRLPKTLNFMRFGRIPEHQYFRFGRSGSPHSFVSPKITSTSGSKSSLTTTDDNNNNDSPTKSKLSLSQSANDGQLVVDHNDNHLTDTGMKLKRDGHLFMRFGRK